MALPKWGARNPEAYTRLTENAKQIAALKARRASYKKPSVDQEDALKDVAARVGMNPPRSRHKKPQVGLEMPT